MQMHSLPRNSGWHSITLEYFCRYLGGLPSLHTFITWLFCKKDQGAVTHRKLYLTHQIHSYYQTDMPEWKNVILFPIICINSMYTTDYLSFTVYCTVTHTHNRFTALWILSVATQVSWYQKKHSSTHTYHGHQSSLISFIHLLQSFSTISLQVFFGLPIGLAPPLHTPYISSPNHCLLSATHAHTIATCFDVVPRLCHQILVSLSTLYLELLSRSLMPHIHLTILISALWSATSFSFLTG